MLYHGYYFSEYTLAMLFTMLMSIIMVYMLWKRRNSKGAFILLLLELAVIEWAITGTFKAASITPEGKLFWVAWTYPGVTATPPLFFLFALSFCNMERFINQRNIILLFIIPLITVILGFTNPYHNLIWTGVQIQPANFTSTFQYGPWFWVLVVYVYIMLSSGVLLIFYALTQYSHYYRHQLILIALAALAPFAGNVLYVFQLSPIKGVDWTPVATGISGFLLVMGLFRYRMFDLVPVGRTVLMETMGDGFMVVDSLNRLVDINTAMKETINIDSPYTVGTDIKNILEDWPQLHDCIQKTGHTEYNEVTHTSNGKQHFFDVKITPLYDRKQKYSGLMMVLRDVTERKRLEDEHRELIGELGAALQHVKTLHGLLPICAHCKKIRDDSGYWHAVEAYVRDHSHADFSHCFCPECLEKLYPEFVDKNKKNEE